MSRPAAARLAAASVLGEARRRDARARELLRSSPRMAALDGRDRALATRLVLGATATSGALDAAIDAARRRGRLDPRVRDCLRLAAFELLWLDTPAPVAASQGVELVRRVASRAAGLANAVLRRVAEGRGAVDEARARVAAGTADADACAAACGMPAWLARRVRDARGAEALRDLAACQLEPAPVFVAAVPSRATPGEAEALLRRAGLAPAARELPGSFELGEPAGLAGSGLVASCDVAACDLAAQAVCRVAAPAPGASLLEVGQGRATKTLLLAGAARTMGGKARVVGTDVAAGKVALAERRMCAAGVDEVRCLAADGRLLAAPDAPEPVRRAFDAVLVDAPCSGTGTMRRHPEIPWSLSRRSLDARRAVSLPRLQLGLLRAAAARVGRGGSLVYATCSVLPEECEDVVAALLASSEGSSLEPAPVAEAPGVASLPAAARSWVAARTTDDGSSLLTFPSDGGEDGHFCCRLVRVR